VIREVKREYCAVNPVSGRAFADPVQAATIANLLQRWIETHTTAYLDDAVIYCEDNALPILPVLSREIARAARHRRGGKPSKGEREGIKDGAFRVMANLILAGATDREAAGKAAVWSQGTPHPMKASSLEKEYSLTWRRGDPSLEDELRTFAEDHPDPETDAAWRELRRVMREPTDEERGERR
jgi:hypothetical protein